MVTYQQLHQIVLLVWVENSMCIDGIQSHLFISSENKNAQKTKQISKYTKHTISIGMM